MSTPDSEPKTVVLTTAKRKGGQAPHVPTGELRAKVQVWAKNGVPHDRIGILLGIAKATVEKHYNIELAKGTAEGIALLCETSMRTALGAPAEKVLDSNGQVISSREEVLPDKIMQMFLLKTRAGYREVNVTETRDNRDHVKEAEFGLVGITESERAARLVALFERTRSRGIRRTDGRALRLGSDTGKPAAPSIRKSG